MRPLQTDLKPLIKYGSVLHSNQFEKSNAVRSQLSWSLSETLHEKDQQIVICVYKTQREK